jgi:hypothetical protein
MAESTNRNTGRKGWTLVGAAVIAWAICAEGIAQDQPLTTPGLNISRTPVEGGIAPSANTTVGNARILIPDGTAVYQSLSNETRWFYFIAEQGKTYTVEALDPYGDRGANAVQLGIFDSDGTSAPSEALANCLQELVAPAVADPTNFDGVRCVIRANRPDGFQTLNKRAMFVRLSNTNTGSAAWIRVRESTIYGRWTTNGYDFHVEVQNTTTDTINVELDFYPGTGTTPPTGTVGTAFLAVPPMGAAKVVRTNGTLVAGDNKGTLRVHATGAGNFVAGSVIVNTYAYNPVTNQFIPYSTVQPVNNGHTSNSF